MRHAPLNNQTSGCVTGCPCSPADYQYGTYTLTKLICEYFRKYIPLVVPQITAACSCMRVIQLSDPRPGWLHSVTLLSSPVHPRSSSKNLPVSVPNGLEGIATPPNEKQANRVHAVMISQCVPVSPSCLHMTLASTSSQWSSHTKPQSP